MTSCGYVSNLSNQMWFGVTHKSVSSHRPYVVGTLFRLFRFQFRLLSLRLDDVQVLIFPIGSVLMSHLMQGQLGTEQVYGMLLRGLWLQMMSPVQDGVLISGTVRLNFILQWEQVEI